MKKLIAVFLIFALIIIPQTGCGKEEQVSDTGFYLDTACTITIYNIEKEKGEKLIAGAFELCKDYENTLSKTIDGSDVDRINDAKGKFVKVSKDTISVIKLSLEMSKDSNGVFDATVGRITDLWDFKSDNPKVPEESKLAEAVKTVGYKQIQIKGDKVSVGNNGAKLDLGAVAKGYIADRVTEYLEKEGVNQAIINLGGNIVTIGSKEEDTPWNIGIERPYSNRSEVIGVTTVSDAAVVTSGIYERKFEVDGKLYHHIIDPKTGYPIENDVEAVTIVSKSGNAGLCDGYSTLCLLMGTKKGKAFIEKQEDFEALFIDKNDKTTQTKDMVFSKSK